MAEWAAGQVGLHFIPAGEPWRNGYIESFNSLIRDECLNITGFWSPTQARVLLYPPMNDSRSPLICARRFEPWLRELRGVVGGRPERFELCRVDVTEVAVASFDVVEVVDVVGHRAG
jgi:transposase InsO family protein